MTTAVETSLPVATRRTHAAPEHTPASTVNTSAPQLTARCLTSLADLHALRNDWLELERGCCGSAHLFQSHDWCASWADVFLNANAALELCLVEVRHQNKLICLLPGMVRNEGGPKTLRALSDPYAQYSEILCLTEWQTEEVLQCLHTALKEQTDIDLVHLRHVREGTFADRFSRRFLKPAHYYETAPFMDLTVFSSDEEYLARYSKVQRRRRKKIANAIEKLGPTNFETCSKGDKFDALLNAIVGNKRTWIAARGLHSNPLNDPRLVTFVSALSRHGNGDLQPVISSLSAGDRLVSHELGLRYRGRHCGFITGHDPELTQLSPARLHMDRSQRLALADGMDTFDLMVPGDAYKDSWSSGKVAVADHAGALSVRGQLHCLVYITIARPIVRAIYHAMPTKLRLRAMQVLQTLQSK